MVRADDAANADRLVEALHEAKAPLRKGALLAAAGIGQRTGERAVQLARAQGRIRQTWDGCWWLAGP